MNRCGAAFGLWTLLVAALARAQLPADVPPDHEAYARFIAKLRDQPARAIVVGMVKDYPRGGDEDLETFLAFSAPREGEDLRARLVRAKGSPVYVQINELFRTEKDPSRLLERLALKDVELNEKECPVLRKAYQALVEKPWSVPLEPIRSFGTIHPRIYYLAGYRSDLSFSLELQPGAPGYERLGAILALISPCF